MLWPVVLPFQITVVLIAVVVGLAMALARRWKWNRLQALSVSALCGCLAFVPVMIGVAIVVDAWRFGLFRHAAFSEVRDFRIERYLPPMATEITLDKYASGHCARYSIRETELVAFVDDQWGAYSQRTALPSSRRDASRLAASYDLDRLRHDFERLGWSLSDGTIVLVGPRAANGAGATYCYDRRTGLAYHRAGYW